MKKSSFFVGVSEIDNQRVRFSPQAETIFHFGPKTDSKTFDVTIELCYTALNHFSGAYLFLVW